MKKSKNIHLDSVAAVAEVIKKIKVNVCKEHSMQSIGKMLFSMDLKNNIYYCGNFEIDDEESLSNDRVGTFAQYFMDAIEAQPKTKAIVFVSESYIKIFEDPTNVPSKIGQIQEEYSTDCTSDTSKAISMWSLNTINGKQASSIIPYKYDDKGLPFFENVPEFEMHEMPEEEINSGAVGIAFNCCFEELKNPGTYFK